VKIRIQHYHQAYHDNGRRNFFLADGGIYVGRSRSTRFSHILQVITYDPSIVASLEAGKRKRATVRSFGG